MIENFYKCEEFLNKKCFICGGVIQTRYKNSKTGNIRIFCLLQCFNFRFNFFELIEASINLKNGLKIKFWNMCSENIRGGSISSDFFKGGSNYHKYVPGYLLEKICKSEKEIMFEIEKFFTLQ